MVPSLKGLLVDAAGWNVDREADVAPIRALIEQGCDLEADVLPTVARNVPDLTHPLKSWGARWLVQDILAARDFSGRQPAGGVPRRNHNDPTPRRDEISAGFDIIEVARINRRVRRLRPSVVSMRPSTNASGEAA